MRDLLDLLGGSGCGRFLGGDWERALFDGFFFGSGDSEYSLFFCFSFQIERWVLIGLCRSVFLLWSLGCVESHSRRHCCVLVGWWGLL